MPEWLEFAAGRTTTLDVLTSLARSSREDGRDPDLAALVQARARTRIEEGREWLERGWPVEAEPEVPPPAPVHGWHNGAAGDWCFGPTPSGVLPAGPIADFHSFRYTHLTARRLEHLATLGLPLRERHVLEVGAGVGDFTDFFLDRGCRVHTTDVKPMFTSILRQRYALHPLATVGELNLDPPPERGPGLFEIVLCYGVLTLVSDPQATLDFLSQACADLLLIDTPVGDGGIDDINPVTVDVSLAGAGVSPHACRPSRAWIRAQLLQRFAHVYVPVSQPNHYDYPVNWVLNSPLGRRAIFVASRRPLDNPQLVADLPDRQTRH
jgi:2-polyprenyl-3-methyl-5-hydroxy-6-metoxy-1,4-benzoquinol methylase